MARITRSRDKKCWSKMLPEMLLKIFALVNVLDRITNVAAVCHSWRRIVASNQMFSSTLDICEFRKFVKPRNKKMIKAQLDLAFARGVNLCRRRLKKLVFDPPFQANKKHLQYASQRCPNLEVLVLPFPECGIKTGLRKAFRLWANLQSLHLAFRDPVPPFSVFMNVGIQCRSINVLKITCRTFNKMHARLMVKLMPTLRVLCIRCSRIDLDLKSEFSSMGNLQELYVSLFKILHLPSLPDMNTFLSDIEDDRKKKGFPSIQVYHACYWQECNSCIAATMGGPPLNIPDLALRNLY